MTMRTISLPVGIIVRIPVVGGFWQRSHDQWDLWVFRPTDPDATVRRPITTTVEENHVQASKERNEIE